MIICLPLYRRLDRIWSWRPNSGLPVAVKSQWKKKADYHPRHQQILRCSRYQSDIPKSWTARPYPGFSRVAPARRCNGRVL